MTERKLEKGFTMVELIAVLMLIGVLAAYAIPKLYGTSDAAYKKAAEQAAADGIALVKRAYAGRLLIDDDGVVTAADTMTQLKLDLGDKLTADGTKQKLEMGDDFYITFEAATEPNVTILGTWKGKEDGTSDDISMDAANALTFKCDATEEEEEEE